MLLQLIAEGMLGQLKLIFVTQPEQYANSFATQIYGYDHDYRHCPPSPVGDINILVKIQQIFISSSANDSLANKLPVLVVEL